MSIQETWFDTKEKPPLTDKFSGFISLIEIPNDFNTFFDQFCTYKSFQLTEAKRNINLLIMTASTINKITCMLHMNILRNCFMNCLCFFCQLALVMRPTQQTPEYFVR
jgi:hypothetical protein